MKKTILILSTIILSACVTPQECYGQTTTTTIHKSKVITMMQTIKLSVDLIKDIPSQSTDTLITIQWVDRTYTKIIVNRFAFFHSKDELRTFISNLISVTEAAGNKVTMDAGNVSSSKKKVFIEADSSLRTAGYFLQLTVKKSHNLILKLDELYNKL